MSHPAQPQFGRPPHGYGYPPAGGPQGYPQNDPHRYYSHQQQGYGQELGGNLPYPPDAQTSDGRGRTPSGSRPPLNAAPADGYSQQVGQPQELGTSAYDSPKEQHVHHTFHPAMHPGPQKQPSHPYPTAAGNPSPPTTSGNPPYPMQHQQQLPIHPGQTLQQALPSHPPPPAPSSSPQPPYPTVSAPGGGYTAYQAPSAPQQQPSSPGTSNAASFYR